MENWWQIIVTNQTKPMSKQVLNMLPELLRAGVINQEVADRIENYFQQKRAATPDNGRMNFVFALIGTVLVSLGIILMVAHNWDQLSRPVKLFFSFLPLVLGQLLCAYSLFKKNEQRVWRESTAVFLFFAVGASLSLVSQTYHIPGSVKDLLFTWMLLAFPLIYIMRSSLVSLLYILGITVYAINDGYWHYGLKSFHYWWMILLVLPHYWSLMKNQAHSNFVYFHHWFIPLSLSICLGTLANHEEEWMFVAYMSMFAAFYLFGNSTFFPRKNIFANGYTVLGSLGTMFILLLASFRDFWSLGLLGADNDLFKFSLELIAAIVCTMLAAVLLFNHVTKEREGPVNFFGFIFIAFAILFFAGLYFPLAAAISINLLVLAAAIITIQRGERLNHLGVLNYGLLIITALVLCRFFDTDISFIIRGLMFIGVGVAFFVANNRLLKKRKSYEK